jgi:hypothetical protein
MPFQNVVAHLINRLPFVAHFQYPKGQCDSIKLYFTNFVPWKSILDKISYKNIPLNYVIFNLELFYRPFCRNGHI